MHRGPWIYTIQGIVGALEPTALDADQVGPPGPERRHLVDRQRPCAGPVGRNEMSGWHRPMDRGRSMASGWRGGFGIGGKLDFQSAVDALRGAVELQCIGFRHRGRRHDALATLRIGHPPVPGLELTHEIRPLLRFAASALTTPGGQRPQLRPNFDRTPDVSP